MKRDPRHLVVIFQNTGNKKKEIKRSLTKAHQSDFGLNCNTGNKVREHYLYDSERNIFI